MVGIVVLDKEEVTPDVAVIIPSFEYIQFQTFIGYKPIWVADIYWL